MTEHLLSVGSDSSSHNRSSSFRDRPRPKLSLKIDKRPRSDSVPQIFLSGADDSGEYLHHDVQPEDVGLCRVRSFKKTSKGVVNIGDKFKSKSTNSLKSTGSIKNLLELKPGKTPSRAGSITSINSSTSLAPTFFRVCVLGSDGVGKSTLIRQFMTSENLGPYGIEPKTPIGEPDSTYTVSVLLDDEESVLEFVDNALMGEIETMKPDCFLVVFSLTDINTFEMARKLVRFIRVDLGNDRAIILVANKTDLVRRRHISEHDAISIASKYDCKYVEISIALNHRVDDLIVGILSQIRLRLKPDRDKSLDRKRKISKPKRVMTKMFTKLFKVGLASETQRCEDLFS